MGVRTRALVAALHPLVGVEDRRNPPDRRRRSRSGRRGSDARATHRTTHPDPPPPSLSCPECREKLTYVQTYVSGFPDAERWDLFRCSAHGAFEYRHRTRRLKTVVV
jgi:hypothetical protein